MEKKKKPSRQSDIEILASIVNSLNKLTDEEQARTFRYLKSRYSKTWPTNNY